MTKPQLRVSIILLVFESYEMVRRQVLYMNSLNLPDSIEVIFADDGSNPPVILYDEPNFKYKMVYREKEKQWTIPKIINYAAGFAEGTYLLFLGVDHMLSPEMVSFMMKSNSGYSVFQRIYAVIDRWGNLLKIQHYQDGRFVDCICDFTSLGWVRRNHFIKLGGMNEVMPNKLKGNSDVDLFKRWCALRGTTRENVIKRSRKNNPKYYMLPEKKSPVLMKNRKGEHWHWLSHMRPVNYLHKLPDRDSRARVGCEKPLDIAPEMKDSVRFINIGGADNGKVSGRKFDDFIEWRHPAEVRWMLGEL